MMTHSSNHNVPVQPALLVLAALLVPVLFVAFAMLYLLPEVGINHFAWPIRPRMSSMMLGATYFGGVYFFSVVLISRQWRHVWLGFLPISAFAGTLGIATLIHWDRFVHERWTFWVWVLLYLTVPLFLPFLWKRNHELTAALPTLREGELPKPVRQLLGVLGVVLTIAAVILLFAPNVMILTWPWTLTPLTARMMAAMFILPGLVGLGMARDGSWAGARYLLKAQAISVALMLIAIVVARAEFDWTSPASWVFTAGMSGVLLLIGYIHLHFGSR
jgi:peptidoglycan/LPS O-acetylase OafA/YrhL